MEKYNIALVITIIMEQLGYVSCTLNCTHIVKSCPRTEAEWLRRQVELGCGSMRYTCMLDMEKNLVEACMWNSRIKDEMVGCPFIAHCDSINGPILIIEGRYFPCQQHGCPESNHTGYSISQMYRYPACYTLAKSHDTGQIPTTSKNLKTETNPSDSEDKKGLPVYVLVLLVVLFVVVITAIVIGIIYFSRHRSKKERSSQHIKKDNSTAVSKKLMNDSPT